MNGKTFLNLIAAEHRQRDPLIDPERCAEFFGFGAANGNNDALRPFGAEDITAGSETELQAVVIGRCDRVDLPLAIRESRAFGNLQRRTLNGEAPERLFAELHELIHDEAQQVWENSWVRFEDRRLSRYAAQVFLRDLLADKRLPEGGLRSDVDRFQFTGSRGEPWLRLPVSYLIKLALADLIGNQPEQRDNLNPVAESLLGHFLNDNSSPETFSFHVSHLAPRRGMGRQLGGETARRFLFTQLLVRYANLNFGLLENGQEARVYFAPHSPQQQKRLNNLIPDAFYRQLFMSPCLSGWDEGEKKHAYMHLCHQVLSRSQMNAVGKLREAGIIVNNLVVLPNFSNTSLANNGVHISLGSKRLSAACAGGGRQAEICEKYLGDLATKIMEHFLPLFVNSYSAAPYRLGFEEFHPEKALGFLPHQLDFTHLRMLWRRWKKKADLKVFGHALTPFGPAGLDHLLSRTFRLRGDLVPDFRLLDYPVCFLSTDESPAYNGLPGNQEQLKEDLADMGVFDRQMSLYQFIKLRDFAGMGFSGFEGRHYSLFPELAEDLGAATNLQALITALAFKYIAAGQVRHRHIPDSPVIESERRQIFFASAAGVPTFYVQKNTRNRFLLKILRRTARIRASRRYPGYLRIYREDYCRALLALLREDGAELIEMFGFGELLGDLEARLDYPESRAAAGRLVRGIVGHAEGRPLRVDADAFNRQAETYYRETLRREHMRQGLTLLRTDLRTLENDPGPVAAELRQLLDQLMAGKSAADFCRLIESDLMNDELGIQPLKRLLNLMLLIEKYERRNIPPELSLPEDNHGRNTSIHQPTYRSSL
ncbi:MAG: hypothetical protein C0622_07385 [Desulfuromonas sp.]|nr:MAG: hypothetical protein C0622_07385 [Desulfuromonas sp.]